MSSSKHKLTLSNQARHDIADYIRHCDYEIGGFGYVRMDKDGDFYVDEVFLAKQCVTGSTVDFMDDGLEHAIAKAAADDRLDDLKFCWHSHVNMGAFWSGTDESMIEGMNNGMTPYIVSLVQNKKGEHKQRVDFFTDGDVAQFSPQIQFDLDLYYELPPIPDHIKATYDEMVTEANTQVTVYNGHMVGGFQTYGNSGYQRRFISDSRRDYLQEKVDEHGYLSLSNNEADDYEQMIEEMAESIMGGGSMWDAYDDFDEDDFVNVNGIDATPLSDTKDNK